MNKNKSIYVHRALNTLAESAIQVFLPIIIYIETNSLQLVILYSLLRYLLCSLFIVLLKNKLVKNQFLSLMISIVPMMVVPLMASLLTINIYVVLALSFFSGIAIPLYYIPMNIHFTLMDKKANVGKYQNSATFAKIIFIIFSTYILSSNISNSFIIVALFSSLFFILSRFVLLKNYEEIKNQLDIKKQVSLRKANKKLVRFNLFHSFNGIFTIAIFDMLPVYLFYSNLSIEAVGFAILLIEILRVIANYFAQFFVDKNKSIVNYIIACSTIVAGCILIIFTNSPITIFIISCVLSVVFPLLFVSSFGKYVKTIKPQNMIVNGHAIRDLYLSLPRSVVLLIFFFIPSFSFMFALGAVSGIGMFLTRAKD